ncbi:uncharacterized protein LOC111325214 isoform X3 [Stylophora pistillata]|uniref:uncharacterized protein LOC111325214 isoform X3 n=1 Tax=Stylophora pistillata TaxID=50429 RepID=UPI000C038F7E|nr:uncharacterized protein LOC111325214 isoform X3 [Stylophora pistillata]
MPLSTTVIGSFRKPSYLQIPDWFQPAYAENFPSEYNRFLQNSSSTDIEELFTRAIREVIEIQSEAGLDVITDGEVDEPVLMRFPDEALEYGIDQLSTCFDGVTSDVVKAVHLCCGYPSYLDQDDYKKADKDGYLRLADRLDAAGFDEISIEDAHRHNDLSLFEHFKKSKVVLGVVKIASSKVESVEEIRSRLKQVLTVLPAERLVVAPDCGLGFLPTDLAKQKLFNMVQAAKSLP